VLSIRIAYDITCTASTLANTRPTSSWLHSWGREQKNAMVYITIHRCRTDR